MNQPRTRIALLIDGDNSASTSIAVLLTEAEKMGDVTIRRIYGNWSNSSMRQWEQPAQHYGFEQRHHGQTAPGKNATDIALTIDVMDILHSGIVDHFCLVTSDSDYNPARFAAPLCWVSGLRCWEADHADLIASGLYNIHFH